MKLFSEKVQPTFTSSDLNILTVESFEEIFFDVYEFEINGSKFIAEKTANYKGSPVVSIPVVIGSNEYSAPFVLVEGKFEVLFNENNKIFTRPSKLKPIRAGWLERHDILEDVASAKQYSLDESELEIKGKINTKINDNVIKGVNKALSRIGNVKKDIDSDISALKETINTKFVDAEQKVKDYYDSKISLVEATLAGMQNAPPVSKYKHLIEESKSGLLAKISGIKTDTSDIIEEKAPWDKNVIIDPGKVQKDIEKNLNQSFRQQIISLKKSVEMMGGGGSVAKQFAAGGTMNGELNVVGNILSGGTNLNDIFATRTGNVDGSGAADYLTVWSDTDTIGNSIAFQETSQGSTGLTTQLSIAGDLSAMGTLSAFNAKFGSESVIINGLSGTIIASGSLSAGNVSLSCGSIYTCCGGAVHTCCIIPDADYGLCICGDACICGGACAVCLSASCNMFTDTITPFLSTSLTIASSISAQGTLSAAGGISTDTIGPLTSKGGDDEVTIAAGHLRIGKDGRGSLSAADINAGSITPLLSTPIAIHGGLSSQGLSAVDIGAATITPLLSTPIAIHGGLSATGLSAEDIGVATITPLLSTPIAIHGGLSATGLSAEDIGVATITPLLSTSIIIHGGLSAHGLSGSDLTVTGNISAGGTLSATDGKFGNSTITMQGDAGNLYASNCIASGQLICSPDICTCAFESCAMDFNVYLSTETTFVGNLCAAIGEGGCNCKVGIGVCPTEKLTVGGNILLKSGGLGAGGLVAAGGLSACSTNRGFVSAGRDLANIFAISTSNVDGSGIANYLPVWSDTDTIGSSIACQWTGSEPELTVAGNLTATGGIGTAGGLSAINTLSANNYFAGSVGIGTNTPDYALDVAGDIGVDQYIYHNGDTDTSIKFSTNAQTFQAGNLSFLDLDKKGSAPHEVTINDGSNNIDFVVKGTDNNPGMKFDASVNRLGINGVGNPSYELDVAGDIGLSEYIYHKGDDDTYIQFETDKINLSAGGSAGITLDGVTNRVGIGTIAPNEALTVVGNISATDGISTAGGLSAINTLSANNYFAGNVGIGITAPTEKLTVVGNISSSGTITSGDGEIKDCLNVGRLTVNNAGLGSNDFRVEGTSTQYLLFADANQNKVGIGISAPTEKLTVAGNTYMTGGLSAINDHLTSGLSATNYFAGSVGIGTNVPTEKLTVSGNLTATGGISIAATTNGFVSAGRDLANIFAISTSNVDGSGIANYLPVWSDTDTIGSSIACQWTGSEPQLTVAGAITATAGINTAGGLSAINTLSANNYFAGNVGIGTTNPTQKLTVVGNISGTGTLSATGAIVTKNNIYAARVCGTTCVRSAYVCSTGDICAGSGYSVHGSYICGASCIQSDGDICAPYGTVCGSYGCFDTLYKSSGSFHIDHPLESKKDTHKLVHSFIEGPQADNIYSGVVQLTSGSATINIDNCANMTEGTFVALNRCTRTFANNESNWDLVRSRVSGNIVTVESCVSDSTADVSWMVIGERQDPHMYSSKNPLTNSEGQIIVEPEI